MLFLDPYFCFLALPHLLNASLQSIWPAIVTQIELNGFIGTLIKYQVVFEKVRFVFYKCLVAHFEASAFAELQDLLRDFAVMRDFHDIAHFLVLCIIILEFA